MSNQRNRLQWALWLPIGTVAAILIASCGGEGPAEEAATATPPPPTAAAAAPTASATRLAPTATQVATAAPSATATVAPSPTSAPRKPTGKLRVAAVSEGVGYSMGAAPRSCPGGCEIFKYNQGISETLLFVDEKADLEPRLATAWTISPDLKFIDMKIRRGVPFQRDFGEMTAEDVAFSYNDANPNIVPESVNDQAGEVATALTKVEALDPQTARFHLRQFQVDMLQMLFAPLGQSVGIYSKKAAESVTKETNTNPAKIVHTGPLQYTTWNPQEKALLEVAFEKHWRKTPSFAQAEILLVPEASIRVGMLESGQVEIAEVLAAKDIKRVRQAGFAVESIAENCLTLMFGGNYWTQRTPDKGEPVVAPGFNPEIPWVGNPKDQSSMERARKVRWALAMTIDRQAIADTLFEGLAKPAYVECVPVDSKDHQSKWVVPYDPVKAKNFLKEAGYPDGFKGLRIITSAELGGALVASWRTQLGVELTVDTTPGGNQVLRARRVKLEVNELSTVSSPDSQDYPLDIPKGKGCTVYHYGGLNYCAALVPEWDQYFFKMNQELDREKRRQLAIEFYDFTTEQMLRSAIYSMPVFRVYNQKKIQDWRLTPVFQWGPDVYNIEYATFKP
jgi:ABC-type transport system substrate-binding protein